MAASIRAASTSSSFWARRGQHRDGQAAMALVGGGLEGKGHARPEPLRGGLLHPELGRNGVGGAEPDAAHVAGEPVGVLGHDLDGLMAIGLEDANGPGGADPMGVQEDHDLPHGLLLGPARDDLRGPPRADAGDLLQALGAGLDDLEGVLAEGRDDALGHGRADAAHLAGGEVLLDALSPGGRGGLEHLGLELKPMRAVGEPDPGGGDPLARSDRRGVCRPRSTRSRLPRACTFRTQKPFSALWKVTRSTVPARASSGGLSLPWVGRTIWFMVSAERLLGPSPYERLVGRSIHEVGRRRLT